MICFDEYGIQCDKFDGEKATTIISTNNVHFYGVLGLYNGLPTAVSGSMANGAVETLTKTGWIWLSKHPKYSKLLL